MTGSAYLIAHLILFLSGPVQPAIAAGDQERGAYIATLSGCKTCHTDFKGKAPAYAGGRALKSLYGTFYVPNITPDRETGIGAWSEGDFIRAMTRGLTPDGSHYFPAFPYTSYTRMRGRDLIDLKAYLDSLPPVRNRVRSHDLRFPYNIRWMLGLWKLLFFDPGPYRDTPGKSAGWNRGAYIVNGPAHCGECHTARNFYGATDEAFALGGTRKGPDGKVVSNITPHPREGIGKWKAGDIVSLLKDGSLPDGDVVGGAMADVVEHSTAHWKDSDRRAVAEYLMSLPPRTMP
jgi:mono/diheme cytochrome c family protein